VKKKVREGRGKERGGWKRKRRKRRSRRGG
jgi:hypothetical protein